MRHAASDSLHCTSVLDDHTGRSCRLRTQQSAAAFDDNVTKKYPLLFETH